MRSSLVAALVSCADSPHKTRARRFAQGLSSDELQFIAGFLGACLLDAPRNHCTSRNQWAERIARYQQACDGCPSCPSDQDHKRILLLEFLCRTGVPAISRWGVA